jgi:WD40 repeat protein
MAALAGPKFQLGKLTATEASAVASSAAAVSPDGRTIAVGGSNSLAVLFDVRTGKEIQWLEGYGTFNDYGAAFTPDGRKLVVWYSEDNMVYLWDLETGKKIREYRFIDGDPPNPNPPAGRGRRVYVAAVSPDGRLIAFGSQSRFFEVRDLGTCFKVVIFKDDFEKWERSTKPVACPSDRSSNSAPRQSANHECSHQPLRAGKPDNHRRVLCAAGLACSWATV